MDNKYRYIGKYIPIHDIEEKVTGQTQYACDMTLSNMLHCKLILSSVAHGKVKHIDVSEAEKLPGVYMIVLPQDGPSIKYNSHIWFGGAKDPIDDELLFTDVPRHVGDRIGAVLAESKSIAEQALKLIKIEYEALPVVMDIISERDKGHIAFQKEMEIGEYNLEEGIEFVDCISTPRVHHAAMETHVAVASYENNGVINVWAPCQVAFQVRMMTAKILEMPLSKVRVIKSTMGGSFGGKGQPIIEPVAAYLSKITKRPVKLVLNRQESIIATRTRNKTIGDVKSIVSSDGKFLSRDVDVTIDAGAYYTNADAVAMAMGKKSSRMYEIANQRYKGSSILTNGPVGGACRGYGSPQIHAITEIHIDRIARALGMDPVDIRLKNLFKPYAKDPFNGPEIGNARVIECVEKGQERFNWRARRSNTKDDGRYIRSVGMACATHGNGYFNAFQDYLTLYLRLNEDGQLYLNAGFHDQGCGTITTMKQIVGEVWDMPIEHIFAPEVDTLTSPYDAAGTQASRVTYVCGAGAKSAATELKTHFISLVCKVFDWKNENVVLSNGRILYNNEDVMSYAEGVNNIQNTLNIDVSVSHKYQSKSNPAVYAVNFCEVEIDKFTGLVRVTDVLAVQDIGKAINKTFVEGQVQGAIQMGIGFGLTESVEVNASGDVKSDTFAKYHVVNSPDMPNVEVMLIEEADSVGPFGAKSVGEISTCAMAPAIINAIEHGLGGKMINDLPATPERVLAAITAD